jgi:hypothetical protein
MAAMLVDGSGQNVNFVSLICCSQAFKSRSFIYYFYVDFGWFMVINATFNNISVILTNCDGQFHWWRKPEYPKKTTDMS